MSDDRLWFFIDIVIGAIVIYRFLRMKVVVIYRLIYVIVVGIYRYNSIDYSYV